MTVDAPNHEHIMGPMGNSNPVVKTTNMAIYHRTDKSHVTVMVWGITMHTCLPQSHSVYEVFMMCLRVTTIWAPQQMFGKLRNVYIEEAIYL